MCYFTVPQSWGWSLEARFQRVHWKRTRYKLLHGSLLCDAFICLVYGHTLICAPSVWWLWRTFPGTSLSLMSVRFHLAESVKLNEAREEWEKIQRQHSYKDVYKPRYHCGRHASALPREWRLDQYNAGSDFHERACRRCGWFDTQALFTRLEKNSSFLKELVSTCPVWIQTVLKSCLRSLATTQVMASSSPYTSRLEWCLLQ